MADPGLQDLHTAKVIWGDDVETWTDITTINNRDCNEKTIALLRYLNSNAVIYPLTIIVKDDDSGQSQRVYSKLSVLRNDDDDNRNDESDLFDNGFADNDLKSVSSLLPTIPVGKEGLLALNYNSNVIRVWDSQDKKNLVLPYQGGGYQVGIPYTGQGSLWVEGVSLGSTQISVTWIGTDTSGNGCTQVTITGNTVIINVLGLDLDIDSDNDDELERDDWEEELEANKYAIGKMVFMLANDFTPLVLQLPQGLVDPTLRVKLEDVIVSGPPSGTLDIWTGNKNDLTKTRLGATEGGLIGTYSLNQLVYNASSGKVVLWLESVRVTTGHDVKTDVDMFQKPDNRIRATLVDTNALNVADEVKYMCVNPNTFFPKLNSGPQIRSAAAADAVYRLADFVNMSMKYITQSELEKMLEKSGLSLRDRRDLLIYLYNAPAFGTDPPYPPGFSAGLYRDYVSGDYVIAIAGTDTPVLEDIIANLRQLLTNGDTQYRAAMTVGVLLNRIPQLSGQLRAAGHSLGGGMASAAAIAAGIHAHTFNAAGLQQHTLRNANGSWIHDGSKERFGNANSWIEAYRVIWDMNVDSTDILTFLQENAIALPDALGLKRDIEGLFSVTSPTLLNWAIAQLRQLPHELPPDDLGRASYMAALAQVLVTLGLEGNKMFNSHKFPSIYYGLLHSDSPSWNAYDHGPPR